MKKIYILRALTIILTLCLMSQFLPITAATNTTGKQPPFTWEIDITHQSKDFYSVVYGNGKYVAVGEDGAICTSVDGEKWSRQASPTFADWKFVAFNGKVFVAGGTRNGFNSNIITSKDGIHWDLTCNFFTEWASINNGVGSEKGFVVTGGGTLLYSKDGYSWKREMSVQTESAGGSDIAYNPVWNGREFVVFSSAGLFVSLDCAKWEKRRYESYYNTLQGNYFIRQIFYDQNKYHVLLFKYDSDTGKKENAVLETADFIHWKNSQQYSGYDSVVCIAEYGKKQDIKPSIYLFKGCEVYKLNPDPKVVRLMKASEEITLNSAATDGESFVVVGTDGAIFKVDKTGKIKPQYSGRLYSVNAAASSDKLLVTVGEHGQIAASKDGKTWTQQKTGTISNLYGLLTDGKQWIAVGEKGTILNSKNGMDWKPCKSNVGVTLRKIFHLNGKYFATGNNSVILYSEDGATWEKGYGKILDKDVNYGNFEPISRMTYNGRTYVAPFDNNPFQYLESKDGVNWSFKQDNAYKYKAYYDEQNLLYKENGLQLKDYGWGEIRYSKDGAVWEESGSPCIKFDSKSLKYVDTNSVGGIWDYYYGIANAITKFQGKYYVFHANGIIARAVYTGKLPKASPTPAAVINKSDTNIEAQRR